MNPESYQKKPQISTEIIIKVIKATCSEAFYYECTNCALFVMKILFSSYPKSAAAIFFWIKIQKKLAIGPPQEEANSFSCKMLEKQRCHIYILQFKLLQPFELKECRPKDHHVQLFKISFEISLAFIQRKPI